MTIKHIEVYCNRLTVDGKNFMFKNKEDAEDMYNILSAQLRNPLLLENEELKLEIQLLKEGLKAYADTLPLYLDCEEIMHFNSELFEFEMKRMDFYKEHPNRVVMVYYGDGDD